MTPNASPTKYSTCFQSPRQQNDEAFVCFCFSFLFSPKRGGFFPRMGNTRGEIRDPMQRGEGG